MSETDRGLLQQVAEKKAFADLRNRAYGYLARREHSACELRKKLQRFDLYEQTEILIRELIEQNAQSDQRFAEQIGRVRFSAGKGPTVLQHELNQHHVDPVIVEEVMSAYEGQWARLAEEVRRKKFGVEMPEDYKQWARQARFLQQRGFTPAEIRSFKD